MSDLNDKIQSYLEKREADRLSARLKIKFKELSHGEADKILDTGDFTDVFVTSNLNEPETAGALKDAFTENISISGMKFTGDLRLVGGKAFPEGTFLLVEVEVPEAPMPVRTLANVIWCSPDETDPAQFHAGLFFIGINKHDIMKVARFLVLQRKAKHG